MQRDMIGSITDAENKQIFEEWYEDHHNLWGIGLIKWLNTWMRKCELELDAAYDIVRLKKRELDDGLGRFREEKRVSLLKLSKYAHYWYVQEYKFNRMLEEKTTMAMLYQYHVDLENQGLGEAVSCRTQDALSEAQVDLKPIFNRKTNFFYLFHNSQEDKCLTEWMVELLHCEFEGICFANRNNLDNVDVDCNATI